MSKGLQLKMVIHGQKKVARHSQKVRKFFLKSEGYFIQLKPNFSIWSVVCCSLKYLLGAFFED